MRQNLKKLFRTAQNYFPAFKSAKDGLYLHGRRTLGIPHDQDFRALRLLNDAEGDYVDIGANHGQSIESIRLYRPRVRLVSFEPNGLLAQVLDRRYAHDKLFEIRPVALGACAGEFTLFTPVYNGFVYDGLASLDRASAAEWLSPQTLMGFDPNKLEIIEQQCKVECLDDQGLSPAFVKIDVQGLEYSVLKGGLRTLRSCTPVLLIEACELDAEIGALLSEYGYQTWAFSSGAFVSGTNQSGNRFWMTPEKTKMANQRAKM